MEDYKISLSRRNSAEYQKKLMERILWGSPEFKSLKESIQSKYNLDITDAKAFPVGDPDFSFRKLKTKLMRETNSASGFSQLMRAGIQTAVNQMYQSVEVTYNKWAHVIASSRDTELYAPLHGMSFPGEVGPGQKYPESLVMGLDMKLKNRKFGEVFPVEKELLEDDQTGQFMQLVGLMAEYAQQVIEVYCYGKLASPSGGCTYAGLKVPTSETKPSDESSYPYSTAFIGGGKNRPASFGALSQANIQTGVIALRNQLNLLGLKMNVQPDMLLHSPHYDFDSHVLMHSTQTPSGAQSAGVTGGAFAINPIQNLLTIVSSRFVFDNSGSANSDSKAWWLMDSKKPFFVAQIRSAAEVSQENPDSGDSFSRDVARWKLSLRANADFIEPRMVWLGSDGSI